VPDWRDGCLPACRAACLYIQIKLFDISIRSNQIGQLFDLIPFVMNRQFQFAGGHYKTGQITQISQLIMPID